MILISNRQRDDMMRYIRLMCECMRGTDNRTYNTKRLAKKLYRALEAKQPLPKEGPAARPEAPAEPE